MSVQCYEGDGIDHATWLYRLRWDPDCGGDDGREVMTEDDARARLKLNGFDERRICVAILKAEKQAALDSDPREHAVEWSDGWARTAFGQFDDLGRGAGKPHFWVTAFSPGSGIPP